MQAQIQVLSEDECAQVHERSMKLLQDSGVRVLSERARRLLAEAGAEVEKAGMQARLPRAMIERAMELAPRHFKLGCRRADWDLEMNSGRCSLSADGGAVAVLDWETGELRPGTKDDWLRATQIIDALDDFGLYWKMVEGGFADTRSGFVEYWRSLLGNCSKHIQDSVESVDRARLLVEILDITFGGRAGVRLTHPFSHVLCPMSPLAIDRTYTDAYLETADLDLPVAIMPMPLMGATAPASLISTMLLANAEFLAMLCVVQAASPQTAVIYAAMPQAVEPHTWRYTGGGVENGLLGAAATAMGRYYGLPVEAATGGTDQFYPGAQAAYERAINWTLPVLAAPDILVGPGLLGGSTILCLEQMVMDVEVFRRCIRLHGGIPTSGDFWLDAVIREAGPRADFIGQKSTLRALRAGGFYLSDMGFHDTYEKWKAAGMPDILDDIQRTTEEILKTHRPLPLDPAIDRELARLAQRADEG
jgi:trimethylamine--corrinoid protein Co-methyltransferase